MTVNQRLRILATVPIDPVAHEALGKRYFILTAPSEDHDTLVQLVPEMVCLISRGLTPIDASIMDAGKNLVVISRSGAGYENVDIEAATSRGILCAVIRSSRS